MLDVQFNAAHGCDALEETRAIKLSFCECPHEFANVPFAVAELSLQFSRALMFHHMGIAINLAVGGIDRSFEPSCVIDGITLSRGAGLAQKLSVAQGWLVCCIAIPAE
jgi:hypothetical protein